MSAERGAATLRRGLKTPGSGPRLGVALGVLFPVGLSACGPVRGAVADTPPLPTASRCPVVQSAADPRAPQAEREALGKARADALHCQGYFQYRAKHFAAARESFRAAYRADPRPFFLLEIAQADRVLGDSTAALAGLRRFKALAPRDHLWDEADNNERALLATGRPWYRRPRVVAAIVGGVAAVALAVGLSVGLTRREEPRVLWVDP